jgi:nitroreductase
MNEQRRNFIKTTVLAGAATMTTLSLRGAENAGAAASAAGDSDIWHVIHNRRSVRKFRPDPVPEEHIRKILDAARMAPSSGNQQPWKFLVVRDPAKIAQLKQACIEAALTYFDGHPGQFNQSREEFAVTAQQRSAGYFSAPVYVIVLTDNQSHYPTYNHYDGPLAAATLMLAARALGYGTVFITDSVSEAVTKSVFDIPDHYTRVCITPVGVPEEWPNAPKKKPLEELIAWDSMSAPSR